MQYLPAILKTVTEKLPKEILLLILCLFMYHSVSEHKLKLKTTSTFVLWVDETELKRDRKVRPFSMFEPTEAPATSLRKNQSSDDLVRDAQVSGNKKQTPFVLSERKNTLVRFVLPAKVQHTI